MSSFFKQTKYDGTQGNKKLFKPFYTIKEDVENIYRISPSCRNLPENEWAVYEKVHFGHGVQDSMNPDKIRARPFKCIQKTNYKTKMVEVECPECVAIENMRKEMDTLKRELTEAGHPADYVKNATTPQFEWLRQHNLDNKWYCYAKNQAGEWNVLKIGHKVKLALDALFKRLRKEDGIGALDADSGVWIRFTKNGLKGPGALTNVEVLREKVEMSGQRVEVTKSAPLTEQDEKAIGELVDVTNCVTVLTYDQINALVESGGDPVTASNIFAMGTKKEASPAPASVQTTVAPVAPAPQPVVAPRPAPVAPVAVKPAPAKPVMSEETAKMGPDEFLRKFASKS